MRMCARVYVCIYVRVHVYVCVCARVCGQKAEEEACARELARQRQLEAEQEAERQQQTELQQRQREQEQLLVFEEMLRRQELERERQRILHEFSPPPVLVPTAPPTLPVDKDVQGPLPQALIANPTPPQSPESTLNHTITPPNTPMFDRSLKPGVSSGSSKASLSDLA